MDWLNKEYSIELHNPLTEEEWDSLTDVDMEHTNSVTFNTKHGKEVVFIKQKHGRWIKDESTYAGPGLDNLQCSECKRNAVTWRRDIPLSRMYRYCPNCGAKMDGGEDGQTDADQ